jgi:hypothetical protein
VDYGHAEAAAAYGKDPRRYAVMSKRFVLNQGRVVGIEIVQVGWRTLRPQRSLACWQPINASISIYIEWRMLE